MNINYQNTLTHWRQELSQTLPQLAHLLPLFMLAVGVGYLFNWLQVPVAWLIGPMVAGIIYAVFQGKPQPYPRSFLLSVKLLWRFLQLRAFHLILSV